MDFEELGPRVALRLEQRPGVIVRAGLMGVHLVVPNGADGFGHGEVPDLGIVLLRDSA